jgi:exonuclease SbcC
MKLPTAPTTAEPKILHRHAEALAAALTEFAERLAHELGKRSSAEDRLLEEAMDKVGGLVEPATDLEALAGSVNDACRAATLEVATTAMEAEDLAARLERRKQLEAEVKELEYRAILFRGLAQELRADHLVAFLQAEALQVLATAGSERLAGLSDGRYRLVCREDEFLVVDTWNGDEERSVRTLSGGETFLASLALALALADQVRSLSVTDRARLDSLFLDEGFGTLDPESLRMVTDAIEQLAGDGRLVGVITHVKDLAEQFPRIEVEKSPSGSRLQLVP